MVKTSLKAFWWNWHSLANDPVAVCIDNLYCLYCENIKHNLSQNHKIILKNYNYIRVVSVASCILFIIITAFVPKLIQ